MGVIVCCGAGIAAGGGFGVCAGGADAGGAATGGVGAGAGAATGAAGLGETAVGSGESEPPPPQAASPTAASAAVSEIPIMRNPLADFMEVPSLSCFVAPADGRSAV